MKATNVSKQAKKAIVIRSLKSRLISTMACFVDMRDAAVDLQHGREAWRMAVRSCRYEIADARAQWVDAKDWTAYLDGLRAKLVSAKICPDARAASVLVNNQLTALKLSGQSTRGGGRKAKETTGEAHDVTEQSALYNANALAYIADAQAKHAGDGEMLEVLGEIAARLVGK